jgi:hypothetical protein
MRYLLSHIQKVSMITCAYITLKHCVNTESLVILIQIKPGTQFTGNELCLNHLKILAFLNIYGLMKQLVFQIFDSYLV